MNLNFSSFTIIVFITIIVGVQQRIQCINISIDNLKSNSLTIYNLFKKYNIDFNQEIIDNNKNTNDLKNIAISKDYSGYFIITNYSNAAHNMLFRINSKYSIQSLNFHPFKIQIKNLILQLTRMKNDYYYFLKESLNLISFMFLHSYISSFKSISTQYQKLKDSINEIHRKGNVLIFKDEVEIFELVIKEENLLNEIIGNNNVSNYDNYAFRLLSSIKFSILLQYNERKIKYMNKNDFKPIDNSLYLIRKLIKSYKSSISSEVNELDNNTSTMNKFFSILLKDDILIYSCFKYIQRYSVYEKIEKDNDDNEKDKFRFMYFPLVDLLRYTPNKIKESIHGNNLSEANLKFLRMKNLNLNQKYVEMIIDKKENYYEFKYNVDINEAIKLGISEENEFVTNEELFYRENIIAPENWNNYIKIIINELDLFKEKCLSLSSNIETNKNDNKSYNSYNRISNNKYCYDYDKYKSHSKINTNKYNDEDGINSEIDKNEFFIKTNSIDYMYKYKFIDDNNFIDFIYSLLERYRSQLLDYKIQVQTNNFNYDYLMNKPYNKMNSSIYSTDDLKNSNSKDNVNVNDTLNIKESDDYNIDIDIDYNIDKNIDERKHQILKLIDHKFYNIEKVILEINSLKNILVKISIKIIVSNNAFFIYDIAKMIKNIILLNSFHHNINELNENIENNEDKNLIYYQKYIKYLKFIYKLKKYISKRRYKTMYEEKIYENFLIQNEFYISKYNLNGKIQSYIYQKIYNHYMKFSRSLKERILSDLLD